MECQSLLEYLEKNGTHVYVYNMDERRLIKMPIPNSRFIHHPLNQLIEMAHKITDLLKECGKYGLVSDMCEKILFSNNYSVRPTSNQIRNSLQRFENYVQAIGFILYGYQLSEGMPNYYNGTNLPPRQEGMSIKDSHLQVLMRGEAGNVHSQALPLINGLRPFVAQDDTIQYELLQTILQFRGKQLHPGAIDYNHYELYNIGGISSNAIRQDLALSALLMLEYHYQELDSHIDHK